MSELQTAFDLWCDKVLDKCFWDNINKESKEYKDHRKLCWYAFDAGVQSTLKIQRRVTEVKVCWGIFDIKGNWYPNLHLKMPAVQQYAENVVNGYIKPYATL